MDGLDPETIDGDYKEGLQLWKKKFDDMPIDKEEIDPIQKVVQEISKNHDKIIEDWCKAYLAELYEDGVQIKPGCFELIEQRMGYDAVSEGEPLIKYYFRRRVQNNDEHKTY